MMIITGKNWHVYGLTSCRHHVEYKLVEVWVGKCTSWLRTSWHTYELTCIRLPGPGGEIVRGEFAKFLLRWLTFMHTYRQLSDMYMYIVCAHAHFHMSSTTTSTEYTCRCSIRTHALHRVTTITHLVHRVTLTLYILNKRLWWQHYYGGCWRYIC